MATPSTDPLPAAALDRWARAVLGPAARVVATDRMPGHSGTTVGVDVRTGDRLERLVLRVPPPGVRRQGVTDVLRQVPLLQALTPAGVPVPRLRFHGDDERLLGVPYLAVDRVDGLTPGDVWDDAWALPPELDGLGAEVLAEAVEALAAIHRVPWRTALAGWDAPRASTAEIERCQQLVRRAEPFGWNDDALALGDALTRTAPPPGAPALVHADFYSNNWMFSGGRLVAVLDWEGSFIGDPRIDVGWLAMMVDPGSWHPSHHPRIAWLPGPEAVAAAYARHTDADLTHLPWHRALAGHRLACLTSYYYGLHVKGRRVDPVWDHFARSAPTLVSRARELLG